MKELRIPRQKTRPSLFSFSSIVVGTQRKNLRGFFMIKAHSTSLLTINRRACFSSHLFVVLKFRPSLIAHFQFCVQFKTPPTLFLHSIVIGIVFRRQSHETIEEFKLFNMSSFEFSQAHT